MATIGEDYTKRIKSGILERQLKSWTEFVDFVKDPLQSCGTLIYRGQADSDWTVTSTLNRLERHFSTKPNLNSGTPREFKRPRVDRKRQLDRFKEMARGRLAFHIPEADDDEWWALAQHHGMATPMLDWTYAPFVALYFAFEQEICQCDGGGKKPEYRSVFALAHHLIPTEETGKIHPMPFSPRWPGNYRLNSQAGLFLRMPDEPRYENDSLIPVDLEAYISEQFKKETYGTLPGGLGNLHPSAVLQKFIIPSSDTDRFECLRFLDQMNINRASLFPDLDGAAQYVNNLWEINWDKAIGFINDQSIRSSSRT